MPALSLPAIRLGSLRLPWVSNDDSEDLSVSGPALPSAAPALADAAFAFSRPELQRFESLLRDAIELPGRPLDSPQQLRAAVESLLADGLAGGSVSVERIPAALHTAEYWHLRMTRVSTSARDAIEPLARAARSGR